MKVEIYKTQNDGSQLLIVTCKMLDNQVVCEGDQELVDSINKGIPNYLGHGMLLPADGLPFLEQLKFYFKSGYLNASDVIENN